jgi:2-dehydro-3-deoxygalactonokinase
VIVAVDSGTTRTRAWVVADEVVGGEASTIAGARDLARTRDRAWLRDQVRDVTDRALATADVAWSDVDAVVAFGMITSELGLVELPHLVAPVDVDGLVRAILESSEIPELPARLLLVPGVRNASQDVERADFMRGEETQVVGLLSLAKVEPPLLYVSVGSHPKFVWVDGDGRIAWSVTTLSGELLWALHRETILADLVNPEGRLADLDAVQQGARVAESAGLSRALFAARLLNRIGDGSPETCSAFVYGAIARVDLRALEVALPAGAGMERIVLSGRGPLLDAYRYLLTRANVGSIEAVEEPLAAIGARTLYERRAALFATEEGRKLRA